MSRLLLLGLCLAFLSVSACGIKGPLYLPEQKPPQQEAKPAAESAEPANGQAE